MEFSNDELNVLRHLFTSWKLDNGKKISQEIMHIEDSDYVNYKPEWSGVINKLKRVCHARTIKARMSASHHELGGEG